MVVVSLLVFIGWSAILQARHKARGITCNGKLKNVGLSFRIFATDNNDKFPMAVSNSLGGSLEFVGSQGLFRHFGVLSNELATPNIVRCPDDRARRASKDFGPGFSDANVSYFVGLDADESRPQMLLSGDRNITNDSVPNPPWILELRTNSPAGWNKDIHRKVGNIALADGSVNAFNLRRLQEQLAVTGDPTNRIQLPE